MNSKTSNPFNIFFGLGLFVQFIFFCLKIVHVVDWSWWWIFVPSFFMLGVIHLMIHICGFVYIYGKAR